MKHVPLILLGVALMFAGCGKSSEQKAVEENLNAEVLKLHEKQMLELNEIRDLMSGIDIELSDHDRLAAAHPKEFAGRSPDDLIVAKKVLMAAKSAMDTWMSSYRMYDPRMKHEDAIAKLTKDRDDLFKIQAAFDSAKGAATAALDAHRAFVHQIAAIPPANRPKN
jgi:hypothetical protein